MDLHIVGIRISDIPLEMVLLRCRTWLEDVQPLFHQIATVNPEFIMEASKNSEFKSTLEKMDMNVADGIGLVFAARFLYGVHGKISRVTGVELTWLLAKLCAHTGRSMFLVGATDGVAARAAGVLKEKFPTLHIVGAQEGIPKTVVSSKFTVVSKEDDELCRRIRDAKPDVLLVAFGAPKQELWISHHREDFPSVRIAVGVGGTFDYLAGIVPYAPVFVRAIGLEWLYRLITQPRRGGRIFTAVVKFPFAVLHEKFFNS